MSSIRTASGLKPIARISVRNVSNVTKAVSAGRVRDAANVSRSLASVGGVTALATPSEVFGYGNSHGAIRISTTTATVTPNGGTPPYTYLWQPDFGTWEAVAPSSQTTAFRSDAVGPGDSSNDNFTCTVTDANGNVAVSNIVAASATNFGY